MQLHRRARRLSSTLLRFRCAADMQHWGGLSGRPAPTASATSTLPVCRFTLEPLKVSEIGLARVCHGTLNCGRGGRQTSAWAWAKRSDASGVVGMTGCAVISIEAGALSATIVLATWLRSEGRLPDLRTIATVTGSQSFTYCSLLASTALCWRSTSSRKRAKCLSANILNRMNHL